MCSCWVTVGRRVRENSSGRVGRGSNNNSASAAAGRGGDAHARGKVKPLPPAFRLRCGLQQRSRAAAVPWVSLCLHRGTSSRRRCVCHHCASLNAAIVCARGLRRRFGQAKRSVLCALWPVVFAVLAVCSVCCRTFSSRSTLASLVLAGESQTTTQQSARHTRRRSDEHTRHTGSAAQRSAAPPRRVWRMRWSPTAPSCNESLAAAGDDVSATEAPCWATLLHIKTNPRPPRRPMRSRESAPHPETPHTAFTSMAQVQHRAESVGRVAQGRSSETVVQPSASESTTKQQTGRRRTARWRLAR